MYLAMMAKKIFTLIFLFLLMIAFVDADYFECYCTFEGNLVISQTADAKDCLERCGKTIGGQTNCDGDCENCCQIWCNKVDEIESREGCLESCGKTCGFKKIIYDVISLFYLAAGIIAAIMLTLNGIRLFSSENPERREEAKRAIWYILLALALVMIGGLGITYLMKGVTKPGSEAETIEQVKGCGGMILSVEYTPPIGKDIEVFTKIRNGGDKNCKYAVVLYDANLEEVRRKNKWLNSGEVGTVVIPAKRSELEGEYSINVIILEKGKILERGPFPV